MEKVRAATTTNVICWVKARVGPVRSPGQEGDDGREDTEDHRLEDELGAHDSGINTFAPAAFDLPVNVHSDNNGIVHDHPDHQKDGKERQNIEGYPEEGEEHDTAGECRDDANGDPQRYGWPQEQDQDGQHHQGSKAGR